ncbi:MULTISPECIES: hypothetical protein, partial [unclassified Gilliamella]
INAKRINNINDHIVTEMRQSDEPPEHELYFQTAEGDGQTKYLPEDVLFRIWITDVDYKDIKDLEGFYCDKRGDRCYFRWNDIPDYIKHKRESILQRFSAKSKGVHAIVNSWEYDIYKQKYHTVLLETDPSKITATGNITIQGQTLNNHDSKIIAGKNVNINVNQLNNISQEAVTKYVYSGKYYHRTRKHEDDYRCYERDFTKADEVVIDNALNTNILDHQIFEQAQLNDTARQ